MGTTRKHGGDSNHVQAKITSRHLALGTDCDISQVGRRLLDYLLNGCIGLTHDGEGGPTRNRRLGMPGVSTVWGSHIDGEGTIVAESLGALPFAFHLCELAIGPKIATSVALGRFRGVGCSSWGAGHFGGSGGKGRLPIPTGGATLLTLAFPVA